MKKKLVSVIIVNFNGEKYLKECLKSLKKENYKSKEVILVDNGSSDQSIEVTKKLFPSAKIVKNKTNLGFAQANNQGAKVATGEYLFLLNNDTLLPKNVLTSLVDYLKRNRDVGVVQPKVLLMDKSKYLDSVGSFFTVTGFLYHLGFEKRDSKVYNHEMNLFSAKGCALLTRADLVKKIGLFDEKFFAYFEETDFCWRVWISGKRVVYFPATSILHKGSVTSSKINYAFISFHSFKNRTASIIKNLEFPLVVPILFLNIIISLVATIGYLIRSKPSIALGILKAMAWNVLNFNYLLTQRSKVDKLRVKNSVGYLKPLVYYPKLSYYYYLFTGNLKNYAEN